MKKLPNTGIPAGQIYQPTLFPMWSGKTTFIFEMIQAGHITPRQDSTTDQLVDVAQAALREGLPSVGVWFGGGPVPPHEEAWKARKLAVSLGCYDADDWMRSRML